MTSRLTFGSLAGAAVSAALVVSAPAPAVAQDAADLASAVTALRAISTLRADFVQSDTRGQQVRGVLTLKRPGKIRFQYEKGVPMLIVSDGSALTFIDYEVRQVQRWPIKNSPLGALLDPSRDVGKYGRVMPTGSDRIVSVEVRDAKRPEYGVITLVFTRKAGAPGGLELSSWAALDSQKRRTIVTLSNQQYDLAVPDNTFRYNDPRGPVRR
ncbi:LolA family protein [Novosphingobium ginsenosidimutans]|uniref:Outer membrane lipoprotein carrier protein LolA n=1 Tax=Novosphingobium ginsenosidimutans TaxID=1176536 RepID=A0A5B8S1T9_9SPHN|nr:outer membrane lipoprotein carrier protein LolA [Novosphingobium ginsenosidimutans]QEA15476.1 outer membrane lipoprotein carrier protein LolA [Novosphingobium ginsenosidimutans]